MDHEIGFKEWQVVCDALADGRQTIILRKGGIHEGRDGFSFAYERFYLFPTRFHATSEQVKVAIDHGPMPEWKVGDEIVITHRVEVESATTLTDWEEVMALADQHIYTEKTVRERFDWEAKGIHRGSIHVARVRVTALDQPWKFPYETRYGGCRSWVKLGPHPAMVMARKA